MIEIRGVTRDFHTADRAVPALQQIDLSVDDGEFLVLLGPSGSGKTTLLRCVAGFEHPDAGDIEVAGLPVFSSSRRVDLPPEERHLGMVFQSYAVWPHMTVRQNISLPLTRGANRIPRVAVPQRVERALAAVKLQSLADRPTPQLSGGQQQRVALARALAIEPRALLMDEPLSNLDARLREEIRVEIKSAVRAIGVTVLYVTHDQNEAMALADRIAVMDKGQIVQIGTASDLYLHPANPHVAEFFGSINWIRGAVHQPGVVETALGKVNAPAATSIGNVMLGIRPEDVLISSEAADAPNVLDGNVVEHIFFGDHRLCRIAARDSTLTARFGAGYTVDITSNAVRFHLPPHKLHVFADA